jgi:integrase
MKMPSLEVLLLQPPDDLDPELFTEIMGTALESRARGTVEAERGAYRVVATFVDRLPTAPNLGELLGFYREQTQLVGVQSMRSRRKILSLLYTYLGLPNLTQHPLARQYLTARMRKATPAQQKDAFLDADLEASIRICERDQKTMRGLRDATLLAFMCRSGMRGDEIEKLDRADITLHDRTMLITIRRSKTDQYSEGQPIWVPARAEPRFCALALLKRWFEIYSGDALFCGVNNNGTLRTYARLHRQSIAKIIKHYAALLGHDPRRFACHSMRSGFVTEGYRHGMTEADMLAVTRHSHVDVLRGYRRYVPELHEPLPPRLGA